MSTLTRYRWWILTAAFLVAFTLFTAEFQQPQTTAVLAATLRHSTPLVLGALCGILCERSGVINIGIEGQMLMSAFAGFFVASSTGDLLVGVAAGIIVCLAFFMVQQFSMAVIGQLSPHLAAWAPHALFGGISAWQITRVR